MSKQRMCELKHRGQQTSAKLRERKELDHQVSERILILFIAKGSLQKRQLLLRKPILQ